MFGDVNALWNLCVICDRVPATTPSVTFAYGTRDSLVYTLKLRLISALLDTCPHFATSNDMDINMWTFGVVFPGQFSPTVIHNNFKLSDVLGDRTGNITVVLQLQARTPTGMDASFADVRRQSTSTNTSDSGIRGSSLSTLSPLSSAPPSRVFSQTSDQYVPGASLPFTTAPTATPHAPGAVPMQFTATVPSTVQPPVVPSGTPDPDRVYAVPQLLPPSMTPTSDMIVQLLIALQSAVWDESARPPPDARRGSVAVASSIASISLVSRESSAEDPAPARPGRTAQREVVIETRRALLSFAGRTCALLTSLLQQPAVLSCLFAANAPLVQWLDDTIRNVQLTRKNECLMYWSFEVDGVSYFTPADVYSNAAKKYPCELQCVALLLLLTAITIALRLVPCPSSVLALQVALGTIREHFPTAPISSFARWRAVGSSVSTSTPASASTPTSALPTPPSAPSRMDVFGDESEISYECLSEVLLADFLSQPNSSFGCFALGPPCMLCRAVRPTDTLGRALDVINMHQIPQRHAPGGRGRRDVSSSTAGDGRRGGDGAGDGEVLGMTPSGMLVPMPCPQSQSGTQGQSKRVLRYARVL